MCECTAKRLQRLEPELAFVEPRQPEQQQQDECIQGAGGSASGSATMIDLPTVSELFQAYYDCRRTKRNSNSALLFEENLEKNLLDLYDDLVACDYKIGPSIVFVVEKPKIREVWAAGFRDRIVHHLLYNRFAGEFHRRFIHDTYACIPGKGVYAALDRIEHYARSVTRNYSQKAYVLQMDVKNFFASIDRKILDDQMSRRISPGWWLDLCRTIIHHDPTKDAIVNSPARLMRKVPAHKSLFNSNGRGLAIGNLTSQLGGNVNIDPLDQHAKHRLKAKYWVRYVDDIVVMSQSKDELLEIAAKSDDFLQAKLGLALHPKKTNINLIERGFNSLGQIVRPHARYVRRSTVKRGMAAVKTLCVERADPKDIAAVSNSYFGIFRQANAYNQRKLLAETLRAHGHLVSPKLTKMFYGGPI